MFRDYAAVLERLGMTGRNIVSRQFTCVAIKRRAVLIDGASGSGKSMLAMCLMDRGAELIGDDSVQLQAQQTQLMARPHPNTHGLIEVRNIGVITQTPAHEAPVCLYVTLAQDAPRFRDSPERRIIENIALPHISIWPSDPLSMAIKVELALANYGLSLMS